MRSRVTVGGRSSQSESLNSTSVSPCGPLRTHTASGSSGCGPGPSMTTGVPLGLAFAALVFVAVALLHWPLAWTLLGLGCVAVAVVWSRL